MGPVSQRGQILVVGLHALLGLAVLMSATVLTALKDPINPELATLFGAIIGLAGGGSAAVSALGSTINGKAVIPQRQLDEMTALQRATVDHLAGARAQVDSLEPPAPRQPPAPIPPATP